MPIRNSILTENVENIQWKQAFSFGVVWSGRYKPLLGWKWPYFWLSTFPLWNISSTIKFRSNRRGNTEKQWLFIESFLAIRLLPHYHSSIQTRSQIGGGYRRAVVEKGDLLMWRTRQWPMVMNFIHSLMHFEVTLKVKLTTGLTKM